MLEHALDRQHLSAQIEVVSPHAQAGLDHRAECRGERPRGMEHSADVAQGLVQTGIQASDPILQPQL
jgi:hypothetical protein